MFLIMRSSQPTINVKLKNRIILQLEGFKAYPFMTEK